MMASSSTGGAPPAAVSVAGGDAEVVVRRADHVAAKGMAVELGQAGLCERGPSGMFMGTFAERPGLPGAMKQSFSPFFPGREPLQACFASR